ncbi:MAG: coenzyme F420-0:L-glutamate ligase [Acidobacteria bacterium]|nr:coenzyme F420-0:L-glutamate ligase [Acidobacteriota bacterium]
MQNADGIQLIPLKHLPEVHPGDDLVSLLATALQHSELILQNGDCLIVAQKIVSKAEGRLIQLSSVTPSLFAQEIAAQQQRDPRLIEVVLRESAGIVRMNPHVLITITKHGFVCANAGVDRSNVIGEDCVALLPLDPDASARRLRQQVAEHLGIEVAVIITDTFGRAWREGLTNVAIGIAGFNPLSDLRGAVDDYGKPLAATVLAIADEIAAASGLLMRKTTRIPIIIARGCPLDYGEYNSQTLIRPKEQDLFR